MADHRRVAAEVARILEDAITYDHCAMTITVYDEENGVEYALAAQYEVCGTCDGRGKVVNPSIDEQGLTQADFDEDPDFRVEYCRGAYDIPCPECGGRNVVLVPDEQRNNPEALAAFKRIVEGAMDYARQTIREREMGY